MMNKQFFEIHWSVISYCFERDQRSFINNSFIDGKPMELRAETVNDQHYHSDT